jgi:hypothetical protein
VARLPMVVLAAVLAVLAGGCGGGGGDSDESSAQPQGTPPATWVTSVCGALDDWQTSLQTKAQGLPAEVLQADSPADAKKRIEGFLDEVVDETDAMIQKVDAAGKPAVNGGQRVSTAVHARLLEVKAAFESARAKVDNVPTDNPLAFQQQLTQIGQQLAAQGQALGDVLGSASAPPLRTALQNSERCKPFTGN